MMDVTIDQVLRGIKDTLSSAIAGVRVDTLEEMTEGVNDVPLVQVYPESIEGDIAAERTHISTFRGGVQQSELVINVDVYARQRSHLAEDMVALVTYCDLIIQVLQAQETKPYFNVDGLQAFRWRGERVTFEYGNSQYVGIRFSLTFRIF